MCEFRFLIRVWLFRSSEEAFCELDHLWHSLRREDGQHVCNQQEPVVLTFPRVLRLYAAQRDALALLGPAPAAVDKRRVEAVHVEVLAADEEAVANRDVAVLEGAHIELDFVLLQLALAALHHLLLRREDDAFVPVLFSRQSLAQGKLCLHIYCISF